MSDTSMMSNNEAYNHYLNGMTPSEIAVHFKEIYPEFGDLDVEEVLLQQVLWDTYPGQSSFLFAYQLSD